MNISDYMGEKVNKLSSKRSTKVYFCTLCNFENSLQSLVKAHVRKCCSVQQHRYRELCTEKNMEHEEA